MNSEGLYVLTYDTHIVPYELDGSLKTILVGVPGAFTPGCTRNHLPGFANNMDKLKEKGIEKVVFVATNDAYVMDAWNSLHGHEDIDPVSDPKGKFLQSIGKLEEWSEEWGIRCSRFAVLIENNEITQTFENPFIDGVLDNI